MTDLLILLALVLSIVELVRSEGRSRLAWAVVLICAAWLWNLAGGPRFWQ